METDGRSYVTGWNVYRRSAQHVTYLPWSPDEMYLVQRCTGKVCEGKLYCIDDNEVVIHLGVIYMMRD